MPGALKIYKDSKARRKNVPIKTEAVGAVVESSVPEKETQRNGSSGKASSRETESKIPKKEKVGTAVYTASPAIAPEEVTPEQTQRAEVLEERIQGDRERIYRIWAHDTSKDGTRHV